MHVRALTMSASLALAIGSIVPVFAQEHDLRDLVAGHIYQTYRSTGGALGFSYETIDDETLRLLWLNVKNDLDPENLKLGMDWTFLLFSTWREDGRTSAGLEIDPILETVNLLPEEVLLFAEYAEKDMRAGIYGMADLLSRTPERIGATAELLILQGGSSLESPLLEPFVNRLFQLARMNDGVVDATAILSLGALAQANMTERAPVIELCREYLEERPNDERVRREVDRITTEKSPPSTGIVTTLRETARSVRGNLTTGARSMYDFLRGGKPKGPLVKKVRIDLPKIP